MKGIVAVALAASLAMPMAAWADDCTYDESNMPDTQPIVSADDFKWMGVVEYNGHCETYYSSRELYHPDTPMWELDEDGFYQTDEGYFVVATDAYPYGEIIETSRGPAQVLDCGCGWNIDFYVDWA